MRRFVASISVAALAVLVLATSGAARASSNALKVSVNLVGGVDGGGEPSIAAARDGTLYSSAPAGVGMAFWRSTNAGKKWTAGGLAQDSSGDTSVNVDASGAVYQSNLGGPSLLDTLQGEVYKSFNKGKTWPQSGTSPLGSNATGNPVLVDRQWTDAWIPPGKTTNEARVYISYHDWVPDTMWVNASTDGGKTFGLPVNVITSPQAIAASICDTIPGGLKIVPSGPHAGRVYVAWIAGDITNPLTGCNYTMLQAFHTIWVAWSDDEGATWTDHLVYDGGLFHDASELFADLTLDNKGNPYLAFAMDLQSEFDVWVEASFDAGQTWNGKSDGTGQPYKVNSARGTHYFPAIAAGDPGKVVVTYLATPFITPTLPNGKPQPNGDAPASWDVYLAQSLNLKSGHPTWQNVKVTKRVMHHGDICTLGIFCLPGTNRNLLDFIDIVVDSRGYAHVVYTDDANYDPKAVVSANQTTGPTVGRGGH
ncbi:MAG TPA: sialidase family protein [Actinomycetota bacterium]|nr:sialidase family protein [Actinomycetota bacterium]